MLHPLLRLLTASGTSPDQITVLAALIGLAFGPRVLNGYVLTGLSLLLDGLDGPLARFQQVASARGSFSDTFADQIVVTATTITWMIHVGGWITTLPVVVICDVLLSWKAATGFRALRRRISRPDDRPR